MSLKKTLAIILILIPLTTIYANLNVMVLNIKNLTGDPRNDYITMMSKDTILSYLNIKTFLIKHEDDFKNNEKITGDLFGWAYLNLYNIVVDGYYIVDKGSIFLTIKCYDVPSESLKIQIKREVTPEKLIFNEIRDMVDELNNEINRVFVKEVNLVDNAKNIAAQTKAINQQNREFKFFFGAGIIYTGAGHLMIDKTYRNTSTDINNNSDYNSITDISSPINSYYSSFAFDIRISGLVRTKKSFSGIFLQAQIPLNLNSVMLSMNIQAKLGYLFNYDVNYFKWTLEFLYIGYDKYRFIPKDDGYNSTRVQIITGGFGFYYSLMSTEIPHVFETGITLFAPYMTTINTNGSSIFDMSAFIIPVSLNLYYGYFLNSNIGLFADTTVICYYTRYYSSLWSNNNSNVIVFIGSDLAISFRISFGMTYRITYK